MIETIVPVRILSTPNLREHWSAKARRAREHRDGAFLCLLTSRRDPMPMPATVTLTRLIGPRGKAMDGDNLAAGCKSVRDGVADFLRVDDGDSRITWRYTQEPAKSWGVRIQIEATNAAS